jgi:RNA polymerase sigma-70 factor (ECF subfamily)
MMMARRDTAAARAKAVASDSADAERARLAGLIVRMAASDQAALAAFHDATLARAWGLTLRIVREAALAEEVIGDAYFQAWRSAAQYDPAKSSPLTWLLMLCRSRALDALRAREPAQPHEDPHSLIDESAAPAAEDPLDLLTAASANRAVHAALAALSPDQRQMIALAFFRGLSHQEIATCTEVPLGTVKSQIRRALAALRSRLGTT